MTSSATAERHRLQAGARIGGKLELVRVIGEGGMGAVWTARNVTTGGRVAIKVLRPDKQGDGHAAERFRYEAKLGATLSHRNITRVFDLLEDDDGSLVLVMELLKGETLRDYYKRKGSLSCTEAVAIMVPVLSALQHAHDHGVIHRDLKPTNIFLHTDPDGQVTPKLIDFGIAKAEDSSVNTRTGDALGTPQYMSPEQVRAIALDGRSDVFSLAVVLYEIITGANPYPGPTSTAVLAQVLELEIDPDPSIEPRVWLELRRALSKQPYQRHASAKELARALCAAVGETETGLVRSLRAEPPIEHTSEPRPLPTPIEIPASTLSTPAPPMSGPPKGILQIGGAILALAVLGLVFVFARPERGEPAPTPTTAATAAGTISTPKMPTTSSASSLASASSAEDPHTAPPKPTATTRRLRKLVAPSGTAPKVTSSSQPAPSTSLGRTPGF